MATLTIYNIARLLHALWLQDHGRAQTADAIETSWAADGADRRRWVEQAAAFMYGLAALPTLPGPLTAAVLATVVQQVGSGEPVTVEVTDQEGSTRATLPGAD